MTRNATSLALLDNDAPAAMVLGEPQLRLLRTFAAVVDAGGLSPAAAALQVDLSTVSRQFAELEAWIGTRLARRGRGGFELTPEGVSLLDHARQLFGSLQAFGAGVAGLSRSSRPVLRMGIVDALMTSGAWLPTALRRCYDELPGLRLQLMAMTPVDIEQGLLCGSLDAGIVAACPAARGLEQHRVFSESSSLYVAPGHPWHEDPAQAQKGGCSIVGDPYAGQRPGGTEESSPADAQADSMEAVALLVLSGRHAGYLPDHFVQAASALATLRAVLPQRFSHVQDIVLTCLRGKVPPPVRALLRALAAA